MVKYNSSTKKRSEMPSNIHRPMTAPARTDQTIPLIVTISISEISGIKIRGCQISDKCNINICNTLSAISGIQYFPNFYVFNCLKYNDEHYD